MAPLNPLASTALAIALLTTATASPSSVVKDYVTDNYNSTFREPQGILNHPYLVPAGPYDQEWDWDSVFTGLALLPLGSAPYLSGSMKNFFEATNMSTGAVTICLDPSDPHPSCSSDPAANAESGSHAKPLLIQGAWLSASHEGDYDQFLEHRPAMVELLSYWSTQRVTDTGLYTWHDQMESGADDLVTSPCPSPRSDCWSDEADANSLVAPDLLTFLIREHRAYANFVDAWDGEGGDEAQEHRGQAAEIGRVMVEQLWDEEEGTFRSFNATSGEIIENDVYK